MAEQLFQIGVKALITNNEGKILLVGRHGKDQSRPHLDLPGGRMDANESVLDALRRELQEEVGVTECRVGELYDTLLSNITIPVGDVRIPLTLVIYKVKLLENQEIVLGEEEEIMQWLAPEQAAEALRFKYPADFCVQISALLE